MNESSQRPRIIAHRGASAYAPENTLAAFRLAIEMRADTFELDCSLSSDGEVVVIHDAAVDRTTDGSGMVSELALAELRRLDAGAWFGPRFAGERIPTLTEALDLAKGRANVLIELKDHPGDAALETAMPTDDIGGHGATPRLVNRVIASVRDCAMEQSVVLQSFSPVACVCAMAEAPDLRVELLVSEDRDSAERWKQCMRRANQLGVHGVNPNKESLSLDRLRGLREQGKSVSVWTVDDETDMRRLIAWNVDGIITNRPDVGARIRATHWGQQATVPETG